MQFVRSLFDKPDPAWRFLVAPQIRLPLPARSLEKSSTFTPGTLTGNPLSAAGNKSAGTDPQSAFLDLETFLRADCALAAKSPRLVNGPGPGENSYQPPGSPFVGGRGRERDLGSESARKDKDRKRLAAKTATAAELVTCHHISPLIIHSATRGKMGKYLQAEDG